MVNNKLSAITRLLPEAVAMVLGVAIILLLFTYTLAWPSPEYVVRWLPNAIFNGIDLKIEDWFRGVDAAAYDGGVRPRIISYSMTVLTAKLRLWLYNFFIPYPNLSVPFLISITASPFLFFYISKWMLGSIKAAYWATCLHLTSVGFLSATSFMAQSGKIIIQPVALLLFLLMARLHTQDDPDYFGREHFGFVAAIVALNFLGLGFDDTYAIAACVSVVLFYRIFIPRGWKLAEFMKSALAGVIFFAPFILFTIFMAYFSGWIADFLPARKLYIAFPGQDYVTYVMSESKLRLSLDMAYLGDIAKSFREITHNYFAPWAIFNGFSSWGIPMRLTANSAGLVFLFLFAVPVFIFSRKSEGKPVALNKALTGNKLLWGLPAAIIVLVVANTTVNQFSTKFVTGFNYGSLASTVLPLLCVAILLQWKGRFALVGKVTLIGLMLNGSANAIYHTRGMGWNQSKYLNKIHRGDYSEAEVQYPVRVEREFSDVEVFASGSHKREWSENHKVPVLWSPNYEQKTRDRLYSVWRNWKDGNTVDFSKTGPWNAENFWFLVEMNFLQTGKPELTSSDNIPTPAKGTQLEMARTKAEAAGTYTPKQRPVKIITIKKPATKTESSKTGTGKKAPVVVEKTVNSYSEEYWRHKTLVEFNKWRKSIPDYEKRLYDRVKQLNKRVIRLTNIVIGGLGAILLIFIAGLVLVFIRGKKGKPPII